MGISPGALGQLELGKLKNPLERERLDGLVAPLKPAPGAVESALTAVISIRPDEVVNALGANLPWAIRVDLEREAANHHQWMRRELFEGAQALRFEQARAKAARVWEVLRPLPSRPADDRRLVIEYTPGYATWALVERLAHESDRATVLSVEVALALADLGVWTADRLDRPVEFQAESREYAQVYLGNARRAKGWFDEADTSFARAKEVAADEVTISPFSRARMLDAEAKLRRDQRRFGEAFALQDRAFEVAHPSEFGILWLNRAGIHQQSSDPAGAIAALQNACATFDEKSDPRDRWVAQFNLAANLLELGRSAEAAPLLPQVRMLAEYRRNTLDLLRVRWLEGKCAASVGRIEEAAAEFDQVWRDFAALGISYDAALAALDLATTFLSAGRLADTRILARQTVAIFRSLKIEREELAAVRVFLEAAERERATVELARQAHRALVISGAPSLG